MGDTEVVKGLFDVITSNIFLIIYLFAAVELYLSLSVFYLLRRQTVRLNDATDNMIKGFTDAPDKDSTLRLHEKIESSLRFITNKIKEDENARELIKTNAGKLAERSSDNRYFSIEMQASMMSTLVQVFPLLGILGTVLAIAGTTMGSNEPIDAQQLTSAFVLAMDTTILGIGLSIIFMLVESALYPKIERVISDSKEYKDIINSVYLA